MNLMSQAILKTIESALEGNLECCKFCNNMPKVKYIINRKGDMDYDPLANIYTARKLRENWDQCQVALGASYFAISCKDELCPGYVTNIRPAKDALEVVSRWNGKEVAISLEKTLRIEKAIEEGIEEGNVTCHPKCKNTGIDDPPTEHHTLCVIGIVGEKED